MLRNLMLLLAIILISSLIMSAGCVSAPSRTDFDDKFEFIKVPGEPVKSCLTEDEVINLKWILNSCEPDEK